MSRAKRIVEKFAAATRPQYPDGRWIPQPGDKVYQSVSGFGGMPAVIHGVVSPSGKTVKVTGGSSLIGQVPKGKQYKLGPAWIVDGDPSVKAREDERKLREQEEKAHKQAFEDGVREAIESEGHRRGLHRVRALSELKPGDVVWAISAFDPTYSDDVSQLKISMMEHVVHKVTQRYFTYIGEHGSEHTSGKAELYWTK